MYLRMLVVVLFLVSHFSSAHSQGVVLSEEDKKEAVGNSFILRRDAKVGAIVYDKESGIEYMRCLVGQMYDPEKEGVALNGVGKGGPCWGKPQAVTYAEALILIKKLQNGWRLPTVQEMTRIVDFDSGVHRFSEYFDVDNGENRVSPFWVDSKCDSPTATQVAIGTHSNRHRGKLRCMRPDSSNDGFQDVALRLVRKSRAK